MTNEEIENLRHEALVLAKVEWAKMTGSADSPSTLDWRQGVEVGYFAATEACHAEIERLYAVVKDRNEQISTLTDELSYERVGRFDEVEND